MPETLEAALLLARETLEASGLDTEFAGRVIDRERERRLLALG